MLQTKKLLPLAFVLGMMIYGAGSGGCSCDDGTGGVVTVPQCPITCPLGQCNTLTGMCNMEIEDNSGNNANNNANNGMENSGMCEDGCAAPEASCDGTTAVSYSAEGSCADGACDFSDVEVREECPFNCDGGACTGGGDGDVCSVDDHCEDGLYCNTDDGACAEGCRDDNDCDNGEFCDLDTNICASDCEADGNEPNDEEDDATGLDFTEGVVLEQEELTLCGGDVDLFTIELTDTQNILMSLEVISANANMTATLLDPDGVEVATEADARDIQFQYASMVAGVYTLRVELGDDDAPLDYNISMRVDPRGDLACTPDLLEPNDEEGDAEDLELMYNQTKDVQMLTLCLDDTDQFSFDANAADMLSFSVPTVPTDGLDVRIVDVDNGTAVFEAVITDMDQREIALPAEAEYIVVVTPGGTLTEDGVEYALRFLLTETDPGCPDDLLENNDVFADARSIADPGAMDLRLCGDDNADWYSIFVPAGSEFTIDAIYDDNNLGDGELTMVIYEETETNAVAIGARGDCGGAPCEQIPMNQSPLMPLQDTTYFIQIQSSDVTGEFIAYDIDISISGCAPDVSEPNQTFDDSYGLEAQCRTRAHLCPADIDFFQINVAADETFSVAAHHFGIQDGRIDLTLFNSMMEMIDTSWSNADCEDVTNEGATGDTTYYLRVWADEQNAANDEYRLVYNSTCDDPEPQTPICSE